MCSGAGPHIRGSGARSGLGLHSLSDVSPLSCPAFPAPAFPPAVFMQRREASLGISSSRWKVPLSCGSSGGLGPQSVDTALRSSPLTALYPQAQSMALLTTVAMPVFSKKNETVSVCSRAAARLRAPAAAWRR